MDAVALALGIVGHPRHDAAVGRAVGIDPGGEREAIVDIEVRRRPGVEKSLSVERRPRGRCGRAYERRPAPWLRLSVSNENAAFSPRAGAQYTGSADAPASLPFLLSDGRLASSRFCRKSSTVRICESRSSSACCCSRVGAGTIGGELPYFIARPSSGHVIEVGEDLVELFLA